MDNLQSRVGLVLLAVCLPTFKQQYEWQKCHEGVNRLLVDLQFTSAKKSSTTELSLLTSKSCL
jgi:hypothetical protein